MAKQKTIEPLVYHQPDDPNEVGPLVLYKLERDEDEKGEWIAQLKWDGWRTLLYKQAGQWVRHSKHDDGPAAKTQIPAPLMSELVSLKFPDGTAFDTEWMGGRCTDILNGRQYLIIHDLHYFNGQWQGEVPYQQRLKSLKTLLALHRAKNKVKTPNIELIDSVELGLLALYEKSKTMPLTEGVVIKRRDSGLIGRTTTPAKNPQWMKVKWRR